MGFIDNVKTAWQNLLTMDDYFNDERRQRLERQATLRDYYKGVHRKQMKVRTGQADDNISLNFVGLVIERGISMLLGEGIEFDMGGEDDEDERQQYIDEVWRANRKDILLHKTAQFGGTLGTCYMKLLPDGLESRDNENKMVPRLVPLDPLLMEIETFPEDIDEVMRYVMRFNIWDDVEKREVARKEITERIFTAIEEGGKIVGFRNDGWSVKNYKSNRAGKWELMGEEIWDYEFAPILHWQNLPLAGSVYGKSDVIDVIDLQDRINFIASNVSKIIRYHAHPKTMGIGLNAAPEDTAIDGFWKIPNADAKVENLEMQSDLTSSQAYLLNLRQSFFDITRTVDITSIADKLGALTNFGLRVLFYDALAKLNSKRELYGEALQELNHRILTVSEISETDGGEVVWPDTLPTDEREEVEGLRFDLDAGLTSKQTAARERGYDYEVEQERIEEERVQGDNIGALLLREFNQGG